MGFPKLGSGERFARLKASIATKGKVRNPGAVAASIGRKKYGSKKFSQLATTGRKRVFKAKASPAKIGIDSHIEYVR